MRTILSLYLDLVPSLKALSSGTPQGNGFGDAVAKKELRTGFVKSQTFTGMNCLRSTACRMSQETANTSQK